MDSDIKDYSMRKTVKYSYVLMFFILVSLVNPARGQFDPELKKWVKIGSMHHYYSARGAEWGSNPSTGLFDGFRWPANYSNQDNFCIIRTWLVCRDFTDENNTFWNYKSAFMGGMEPGSSVPIEHKMVAQFDPPDVYVDDQLSSSVNTGIDAIDPSLPCDRKVVNTVNTPIGVTMTRNVYANSQQYHDNYFIIEYILENTGNIDADDEIELPLQTVKDLYLGWLDHYANREAAWYVRGEHAWGKYMWVTQRGENYANYITGDSNADSMRCTWAWLGQVSSLDYDNIGGPLLQGNGRLTNAQHIGMIYLHADNGPDDSSDNPDLPVMGWNGNDTHPASASNGRDVNGMRTLWEMFAGTKLPENGQYGGYDRMDERGVSYPEDLADAGGASALAGFGPFTLEPGEKVRIVVAEGISGINRQLCEEIGWNWNVQSGNYILPGGSTTSSRNDYKNAWVYTGKDSILQTFSRARKCFENGYIIPQPPNPPENFTVRGMGNRIRLSWDNPRQGYAADFAGFNIYRAVEKQDTVYQKIFSCTMPDSVHTFDDITAIRGFSYYYYITAFNDGSNNDGTLNPKGPLESSRFYTTTVLPAALKRPPGETLEEIRVVPNPYNITMRSQQYGTEEDRDKIMFLNIPGECIIRIFTERGDLIKTLYHNDGTGDEAWNSVTSRRQVVVSGIYIAHIETPDGQSIFKKFIIIR